MKGNRNLKTVYRLAAAGAVLVSVMIVCTMYLTCYNVAGDMASLEAAASKYTEKHLTVLAAMEVPENTKTESYGIYGVEDSLLAGGYLVALCESEVEGDEQWTGPVLFEQGINGKYRMVESHLTNLPWPVEATSMNDSSFGMFGGEEGIGRAVLVLWSDIYPEEMTGYRLTYYDMEAYTQDGSIVPLELDVPVEPGSKLHMTCVNIPFNYYDRDFVAYDAEGNEIDLWAFRESQGNLNGDGESRSGDSGVNPDLYGCVLLAGLITAGWFWKKAKKL